MNHDHFHPRVRLPAPARFKGAADDPARPTGEVPTMLEER